MISRRSILTLIGLAPAAAVALKLPAGAELPLHVTDVIPDTVVGVPSMIVDQWTKADLDMLMAAAGRGRPPVVFNRIRAVIARYDDATETIYCDPITAKQLYKTSGQI